MIFKFDERHLLNSFRKVAPSEGSLNPSVPIQSETERKALLNSLQSLSAVYDIPKLIDPRIVAANLTSQFRLSVLDEDKGRVEVRRCGRGWGRDVTVAAVAFSNDADFERFLEVGSFAEVKKALIESLNRGQEVVLPLEPLDRSEIRQVSRNM